jgi:multidrug efflux pump subunit AcrA (membrane-fusion protein)
LLLTYLESGDLFHMALEKKTKKRIRLIVFLVILVLLIGGVVVYDTYFKDKTVHITATTAAKTDIEQYVSLSGTVKSASNEKYFAPAQVTVNKVNIKKGDVVKAGDLLAEFDVDELKNSYNQAALQYTNAKLAYDEVVRTNKENDETYALKQKQIQWAEDDIDGLDENSPEDAKEIAELREDIAEYKQDKSKAFNSILSDEKVAQLKNSMNLTAITVNSAKKYLEEGNSGITAGISGVVTELNLAEGGTASPAAACIVKVAEPLRLEPLGRRRLHLPHARYRLLEMRSHIAAHLQHASVAASQRREQPPPYRERERHDDEREQCELPRDLDQDPDRDDHLEDRCRERRDVLRDERAQQVRVAGQPIDDLAGACAVVEAEVQLEQVRVDLIAQVPRHRLLQPDHQVLPQVVEDVLEQEHDGDRNAQRRDRLHGVWAVSKSPAAAERGRCAATAGNSAATCPGSP